MPNHLDSSKPLSLSLHFCAQPHNSQRGAACTPLLYLAETQKASFCGAPHYIWPCGLISQPPSIILTFTTSPSPPLLHPSLLIFFFYHTSVFCEEASYVPVLTRPLRPCRQAHIEYIYQQSPYEGSGNFNIPC